MGQASRRFSFASVSLGAFAAGPAFLVALGLCALIDRPDRPVALFRDPDIVPLLMAMTLAFSVVGAIIAFPLATLGTMVLTELGRDNDGLRLPVFWTLSGAFAAGLPLYFIADDRPELVAAFAFAGAVAASISRWRVRWGD
ncbi:hypothetical protein [Labrys neptuniae]|uniref:Uncharacterized protein n=1 Tax=Labrys neptuniae TaxID=376174 RepID=A0ABV3PIV6_9HYPH